MGEIRAGRVDEGGIRAAAERLVGGSGEVARQAGERFVQNADQFGIDFEWLFATAAPGGRARQVCLAVVGPGRTAMLFLSAPGDHRTLGDATMQREELALALRAALGALEKTDACVLAQALPEPHERWSILALEQAGLTRIGDLAYLKRVLGPDPIPSAEGSLPDGVRVETLDRIEPEQADRDLTLALERSYVDTLDCPELCGMRDTADVIASHRSTGSYDPRHWRIIYRDDTPEGCCLLSECPQYRSGELVYIGASPRLRGLGVGRRVLIESMRALASNAPIDEITCAVDRRNVPALRMYAALGFSEFTSRIAYVAGVRGAGARTD